MSVQLPNLAYARAVFEVADRDNVLDAVCLDFRRQLDLMETSKEFSAFIRARSMDQSRAELMETLFAGELHPLTLKFLKFLAYKNRLENFPAIIQEFLQLYREKRGIAALDVTSYGVLDDETLRNMEQKWGARLGKKIELNIKIDPSILGGVVFKVKDRVEDGSIKSNLERLRNQLVV